MNSPQEPLVSVVTPVYNGESYLRECIESVLAQTYTCWDYTIVNNCSTDRTLEIAREYAAKDPRIRVHSNENFVPVVGNHNIAFRQISPASKYCKVVAADDWIFPDCLEKMIRLAEEHPSVVIVQAYRLEGKRVKGDGLPYPSTVVRGRDACRMWLLSEGLSIFGAPTSLLYRSDIVRSRHSFYEDETSMHEDAVVCLEFLQNRDYGFVHEVLTFQRIRENSYTSYSLDVNTYMIGRLHDLITYGPTYLSENELQRAVRELLRDYYRYLGWQVFKWRNREFWTLHREALTSMGNFFSPLRIVWQAFSNILDKLLNPKRTVENLVERCRSNSARHKA